MPCSPITPLRRAAFVLALALLAGCGGKPVPAHHAVDTHPDDACAVCGMYLDGSPGPRAEAWISGRSKPLMFDSTRDFFAYVLQPENRSGLRELYVQDTARIDWPHPGRDAASFIDARRAVYVAWQPLPGSMGPTFAPFADRAAAGAFVRAHGGAVLTFDAITSELVATLGCHCPAAGSANDAPCMAPQTGSAPPAATASAARPAPAPGPRQ